MGTPLVLEEILRAGRTSSTSLVQLVKEPFG
jgi:hypothetical protein